MQPRPPSVPLCGSSSLIAILHVFAGRAFAQVRRILARRKITGVENAHSRIGQFPRLQVVGNADGLVFAPPVFEAPVTVGRLSAQPRPAFIRATAIHLRPEAVDVFLRKRANRLRCYISLSHLISPQDRLVRAAAMSWKRCAARSPFSPLP